jgi:small subunit ribosomal protein S10
MSNFFCYICGNEMQVSDLAVPVNVVGPLPLPTRTERFTIRRSTFIDKDSHEHYEIRTHNRLIDVLDPDSKTIDMLMRLNLPAGVDIEIKI